MPGQSYVRIETADAHRERFAGRGDWAGPMLYNKRTGYPIDLPQNWEPHANFHIVRDWDPYMFRGRYVGSRSDHADLRARTGFVRYEPTTESKSIPKFDGPLERNDRAQDWLKLTKEKVAERAGLDAKALDTAKAERKALEAEVKAGSHEARETMKAVKARVAERAGLTRQQHDVEMAARKVFPSLRERIEKKQRGKAA